VHWKGVAGARGDTSWTFTQNVPFLVHLAAPAEAICSLDGHTFTHIDAGTDSGQNDLLFALKQGSSTVGWKAKAAIYYCTVREDETVMRDFVPVKRVPDGKPGMFDKANGVFYVNIGSGEFTPGPVVVPEGAGESGSLRFEVPEGATATCGVLLVGDVRVVKDGAGTLVMAKASQQYFGGTEIAAGTMKPGTSGLASPCGMEGITISAAAEGTIDFNGNANMQKYVYDLADGAKALNGGAAISSGAFTFTSFYTPVSTGAFTASLADGATIDLTEWDGEWPVSGVTAAVGTEESPTTVTLKVDAGSAKFRNLAKSKDAETGTSNGYLLTFCGARAEYTSFALNPASARSYRLIEDENGDLILAFLPGTALIIK
jgi:autotransporter-associated beta strand protein